MRAALRGASARPWPRWTSTTCGSARRSPPGWWAARRRARAGGGRDRALPVGRFPGGRARRAAAGVVRGPRRVNAQVDRSRRRGFPRVRRIRRVRIVADIVEEAPAHGGLPISLCPRTGCDESTRPCVKCSARRSGHQGPARRFCDSDRGRHQPRPAPGAGLRERARRRAQRRTLDGLTPARGFLQSRVGSELRMKHTPQLDFATTTARAGDADLRAAARDRRSER